MKSSLICPSVHHNFTQNNCKMFLPTVGHPGGLHINIPPANRIAAIEMQPRIEQRRVLPRDRATLGLCREAGGVEPRPVGHVHRQLVQIMDIVRVRGDLVLALALPGQHKDTVHALLLAQVDHPHGLVRVIVVKDGAVGQVGVLLAVNGETAVPVLPLLPAVALVVGPRLLFVGFVGH